MKQVTHFTEMPESIRFESFPGKAARVWLRKNVAGEPVAAEDGAEYTAYKADEVYFETTATEDEVKPPLMTGMPLARAGRRKTAKSHHWPTASQM